MKSFHLVCLTLIVGLSFPFAAFSAVPGIEGYRTQRPMRDKTVQSGFVQGENYSRPEDVGTYRDEVAESDESVDDTSRTPTESVTIFIEEEQAPSSIEWVKKHSSNEWVKKLPAKAKSETIAIKKKSQPFRKSPHNIVPNRPSEGVYQLPPGPEYDDYDNWEYVCQPEAVFYGEQSAYVRKRCLKRYAIPAAMLAGGVAAGSASAVSKSCNKQGYTSEPPLDFTMQVTLDTTEGPATFEMEILYPNSTVFYDWLVAESTGIVVETSTSPSTVNYFPGDQFTVMVLDGVRASNFSISGRINGVVFETQTIATPAFGDELIFTIP